MVHSMQRTVCHVCFMHLKRTIVYKPKTKKPTSGCLHFHHMWINCEAPLRLLSSHVCHRLQAVNISVQWSCIWRQPRSWVRLTGLLRASAQESLQYLIAFFFVGFLFFECTLEWIPMFVLQNEALAKHVLNIVFTLF